MKKRWLYGNQHRLTRKYIEYPKNFMKKFKKLITITRMLDSGVITNKMRCRDYAEKFMKITKELNVPQMFSCIELVDDRIRVYV